MAKAKSKRQLLRDERRKKKREHEQVDDDDRQAKRQRRSDEVDENGGGGGGGGGDGEQLFFEDDGGDAGMGFPANGGAGGAGGALAGEFFGMLSEEEQEYFRRADELLELNDFGSDGGDADTERRIFLASVFREARGKELKLASSQSCSRLMERLVQVASRRQLRHLFGAFAEHYATLVTHRFASHCCEQLFLQAAQWVGRDEEADVAEEGEDEEDTNDDKDNTEGTMADLYLLVLDELEPHLTALLTDRFASHTLRVLLVVLSGRPQDAPATRSLLRSKNKETVRVGTGTGTHGAPPPPEHDAQQQKPIMRVPPEFAHAIRKILADVATHVDAPSLRVLAIHPTGNPVLQLLVELAFADAKARKENKTDKTDKTDTDDAPSLIDRLLPGCPASLQDPASPATDLLRSLVYDRIGSRLLETLVVHSPAKLFKALHASVFAAATDDASSSSASSTPMATFLRNDIACYPAMRVLERLGRDELQRVVQKQVLAVPEEQAAEHKAAGAGAGAGAGGAGVRRAAVPLVSQLVQRRRFHVLRTLLERCVSRAIDAAVVQQLVRALEVAAGARRDQGGDPARLITVLCWAQQEGDADAPPPPPLDDTVPPVRPPAAGSAKKPNNNTTAEPPAADPHGCQLLAAMLALPGAPAFAVETALRALEGDQLAHLATASTAGARVLIAALATAQEAAASEVAVPAGGDKKPQQQQQRRHHHNGPPAVPLNKQLVARLVPHTLDLAASPAGHTVLVAIVQTPSRAVAATPGATPSAAAVALSLPFHLKDAIIAQLAAHEDTLRESWTGRAVWRAWRGDLWRTRRSDWVHFAKAGEPEGLRKAMAPVAVVPRGAKAAKGANAVVVKGDTGEEETSEKTEKIEEEKKDKKDKKEKKEKKKTERVDTPVDAPVDAPVDPPADSSADVDMADAAPQPSPKAPKPVLSEEEERARQEKNARRKEEKRAARLQKAAKKPTMTLAAIKEKRRRKKEEKREKRAQKETTAKVIRSTKEKRENKYAREKLKRQGVAVA